MFNPLTLEIMAQEYGSLNNMILGNKAKRKDNKPVV